MTRDDKLVDDGHHDTRDAIAQYRPNLCPISQASSIIVIEGLTRGSDRHPHLLLLGLLLIIRLDPRMHLHLRSQSFLLIPRCTRRRFGQVGE